jgi:hypothetical protein
MSNVSTNTDKNKFYQEDSNEQRRPSAPPRHGSRPRGGVGVELPDDDDFQPCSCSESQPGGETFRYVT